ncbi:uncharacterized protein LOC112570120 isoform X2 [Pomacea canaliculata]|nr:uncharacterized protein LOC112570120 isoform X2 [Pomacea canaliculata]
MRRILWVAWAATLLALSICRTASASQGPKVISIKEQLEDLTSRFTKLEKKVKQRQTETWNIQAPIQKDGWTLCFRATAGLGSPVYDTWTHVGYHDDYKYTRTSMPCGCTATSGSCDRHYRSFLVDVWPSRNLEKVKVALYENGVEKAFMEFRGLDSNYLNWFSADRLLNSSWTDISGSALPYFSIFGIDEPGRVTRRFYVSKGHYGCPSDFGWISIKDKGHVCTWETASHLPTFFYSKAQTGITWETQGSLVGRADVLAVWLKLRSDVDMNKPCLP